MTPSKLRGYVWVHINKGMPVKKKTAKKTASLKSQRPSQFEFESSVTFKRCGLDSSYVAKIRDKYVPKTDKLFIRGSGYFYTKSGVDIILKKLGLLWSDLDTKREWVEVVTLTGNYKRIFCEDMKGETVRVKVTDSKNFMTGMIVPITNKTGDTASLDRKCPRAKGVW